MPQDTIKASASTITELFKRENLIFVPIFQRPYVWTKSTIDKLFEDIEEIDISQPQDTHFLGAVFLSERKAGEAGEPAEHWLIDGQQRLTTVYLSLMQLSVQVRNGLAQGDSRDQLLQRLEWCLFETLANRKLVPRLSPTLRDSSQFQVVLKDYQPVETSVTYAPNDGPPDDYLARAFVHVGKRVAGLIKKDRKVDLLLAQNLFKILLDRLLVVRILVSEADDPTSIFHTLNALGQKLEVVDLVRNDVFQRIKDHDPLYLEATKLFETDWQPLEARFGTPDRFNRYLFPYVLTTKPSAKASKLFPSLRETFRAKKPKEIIADLGAHVGLYLALAASSRQELDALRLPDALRMQFLRLRAMDAGLPSSTYPFIFNLHAAWKRSELSDDNFLANLRILESFLVRRFLTGKEPTGLHAVFKGMWQNTLGLPHEFLAILEANTTNRMPDDSLLAADIKGRPILDRSLTPFVLGEYERSFGSRSGLSLDYKDEDSIVQPILSDLGIEDDSAARWGNLILSQSTWPELGWSGLRSELRKSTMQSVREVAEHERWDVAAANARAEKLAAWAIGRWPRVLATAANKANS